VVLSLSRISINPHPFVPVPTLGCGEETEKQGEPRLYAEAIPCFSEESVLIGFNERNTSK
jgi:hypothetical protein